MAAKEFYLTWGFVLKAIIAPVLVIAITAVGGFALGHTQTEGHDRSVSRLNDGLVRLGRLEEKYDRLSAEVHRIEVDGVNDRFKGSDARDMEARIQVQLDKLNVEIKRLRKELGL